MVRIDRDMQRAIELVTQDQHLSTKDLETIKTDGKLGQFLEVSEHKAITDLYEKVQNGTISADDKAKATLKTLAMSKPLSRGEIISSLSQERSSDKAVQGMKSLGGYGLDMIVNGWNEGSGTKLVAGIPTMLLGGFVGLAGGSLTGTISGAIEGLSID